MTASAKLRSFRIPPKYVFRNLPGDSKMVSKTYTKRNNQEPNPRGPRPIIKLKAMWKIKQYVSSKNRESFSMYPKWIQFRWSSRHRIKKKSCKHIQEVKKFKEDLIKHLNELIKDRNKQLTKVKTMQLASYTHRRRLVSRKVTRRRKHQEKEQHNQGMDCRSEQKIPKEEIWISATILKSVQCQCPSGKCKINIALRFHLILTEWLLSRIQRTRNVNERKKEMLMKVEKRTLI